jgi:peptide/nickel transport system permease protein
VIGYLARRVLWMLPVLWAAATLVWIFMFLIPGDPARMLSGQSTDPEVLAAVRAEWGLDQPALTRYAQFLGKLARLDLGTSYVQKGRSVSEIVAEGMWRTLSLALTATVLGAVIGLSLGALSAARRGSLLDGISLAFTTASITLPTFWLGLMLMLLFASRLGWLPVSGYGEGGSLFGLPLPAASHLVLPSITLAIFSSGYLARVTRASLIEESSQDYARAARARGASESATLLRHVMANSLLPIVTLVGLNFGHLLGGAIATETVFNWPGLGRVMTTALGSRDLPVVEGGVIVMTGAFLLVNLTVDISYAILDPRIRD